jgi:hypothetical protein
VITIKKQDKVKLKRMRMGRVGWSGTNCQSPIYSLSLFFVYRASIFTTHNGARREGCTSRPPRQLLVVQQVNHDQGKGSREVVGLLVRML